ncbi:hypothetical protein [Nocardia farcinica]
MTAAVRPRLLPLQLDRTAAALLQAGALTSAVSRGLDYIVLPDHEQVENLGRVEAALPFHVWGVLFLLAAIAGIAGMVASQWTLAVAGHGALAGLYLAFGVGALLDLLARGQHFGWRTGVGWILGGALLHVLLAEAALDVARRRRD